jgi:hypothetical protein
MNGNQADQEETNMTDVLATLQKLPPICASRHPSDHNQAIMIRRGIAGYYLASANFDVDGFNIRHGITAAQIEAMEIGSMFGWDVPGANPDNH